MQSQKKLGVKDVRKQGAPSMGNWFWDKDSMLADLKAFYGDRVDEGYTCAWKSTYAGYIFGWYADYDACMKDVMRCDVDKRYGFELILEDAPCRGYFDVEWCGVEDAKHETIGRITETIIQTCWDEYQVKVTVNVSCGSRSVKGVFKNSYHVTVHGVIFQNNHVKGGGMKGFVAKVIENSTKRDGECIDGSVYTRWRQMRQTFCSKREVGALPLLPMGGSTLQIEACDENNATPWKGYEIMCRKFDGGVKFIADPERDPETVGKSTSIRGKRKASEDHQPCEKVGDLPMNVVSDLNEFLGINCESTCEVSGKVKCPDKTVFCWLRNKGLRKCLVSEGITHQNENAFIYSQSGSMYYRCRSETCKGKQHFLGYAPESYTKWVSEFTGSKDSASPTTEDVIEQIDPTKRLRQIGTKMDQDSKATA